MAKKKTLKFEINIDNINDSFKIDKNDIAQLVEFVLMNEKYDTGEIGVVFVNHNYIIELNQKYLGKSYTTDVISFPLDETEKPEISGEIYINLDAVKENSIDLNVPFAEEVFRMVIHGVLHLTGFNDITSRDKKAMTNREDFYLENYGKNN